VLTSKAATTPTTVGPASGLQAGQVVRLPGRPGRKDLLPADRADALATVQRIANQQDFGVPLALAADNYALLHQCLQEVHEAARQCHAEWRAGGGMECLAAAQGLDIKSALLNGLYTIRVLHKDWLSSIPVTSPESLAHVLPLFSQALNLCENHSDAVAFPILGLQPALAHLHQQVGASLQSLEAGQWQASAEGRWYERRHEMVRSRGEPDLQSWPALNRSAAALPPAFEGLAAQCRCLGVVLEKLQAVLAEGPASRRASQRSFKSALSTGRPAAASPAKASRQSPARARLPVPGAHTPALAGTAQPRPAAAAARTTAPDPALKAHVPQAPRHLPLRVEAVDSPQPDAARAPAAVPMAEPVAPAEAAAVELPAVDPAEAARLLQEQVAALQADLDQLLAEAHSPDACEPASGALHAAAEPAWARHSRTFKACEARSAGIEALAARAGALSGSTRSEPAVERLQQAIDAASRNALARASEAAQAALADFAQAFDKAVVQGDLKGAGVASYADLAQHCRALRTQWQTAALYPRLPELGLRMALYGAYETVCAVMGDEPGSTAEALDKAGHLDHAARMAQRISGGAQGDLAAALHAFPAYCMQRRNDLLRDVARMQGSAIDATRAGATEALVPVLPRSWAVSATYDVLLTGHRLGDPLPDDWDHKPDARSGSASSSVPTQTPAAGRDDLPLAQAAREVAARASHQIQGSVELPADAPDLAAHELRARLAMLRETELTAQTAAAMIGRFHELAAELESARPDARRAIVRRHLDDTRRLAAEHGQALQALDDVGRPSFNPELRGLLKQSKAQLRAARRMAARLEVSLKTLNKLLDLRANANQVRRRIMQGKDNNPKFGPISGWDLDAIAKLNDDAKGLRQQLADEPSVMEAERESLARHASGLEEKIKCDTLLIEGKLLLDLGAKMLQRLGGAGKPPDPARLMAVKGSVAGQYKAFLGTNLNLYKDTLPPKHDGGSNAALEFNQGRYKDQLEINNGIRKKLKELGDKLNTMPMPLTAAGSSNASPSVARLLGIPDKGKPSRQSLPRRR